MSNAAVAAVLVALLAAADVAGLCGIDQAAVEACRSYCAAGSTEAAPGQKCCDAVRKADFACLCRNKDLLKYASNIDGNRAMQIPSKCSIPGAPTSCN